MNHMESSTIREQGNSVAMATGVMWYFGYVITVGVILRSHAL